ncbi:MAG: hypothetical protein AB7G21_07680 [Dehalococcoidia bacterium]
MAIKRFLAPLTAVAMVAVLAGALIATPRSAEAAAVAGTVSSTASWEVWNNASAGIPTTNPGITVSEPSAAAWAAADTIVINHAGITSSAAAGAVCTNCTVTYGAGSTTINITGVTAGTDQVSLDKINLIATANMAATTINLTVGSGNAAGGTLEVKRLVLGWATTTGTPAVLDRTTPSFPADTSAAGGALCAAAANAAGTVMTGLPITFSVSLGVVSTGSSKTATSLTNSSGTACTNYRGGGGIASTDTAIASNSSENIVDTLSITLTAPTGNTASRMNIIAPSHFAIAPNITNTQPGYSSPTIGSNVALRVTDSGDLGVNQQVILVTVDRGALVANAAFGTDRNTVCQGVTQKSITLTTNATNLNAPNGTAGSGYINFTVCANQNDQPGPITITADNITTSMANATQTITQAGRPAEIETAVNNNNQITATVTDSGGNPVADGTPVRFTLSQNAGAVSNTCTTTSNGKASTSVALVQTNGSVIVSADWNETGTSATAATCASPGSQQISTTASVGGGGGTPGGGGTTGPGTFAQTPVFSSTGLAQVVFNGGTLAQLESALTSVGAEGAWGQSSNGQFHLYIVGGGFVNDGFRAAFPNGFSGVTAMTLVSIR